MRCRPEALAAVAVAAPAVAAPAATATAAGWNVLPASTTIPDCPTEYNTLGKMDNFFAMRCGHEGRLPHQPRRPRSGRT